MTKDEFLDKKRDYSPFLVHLTRDGEDVMGNTCVSAKDVLDTIISERTLEAYNHFCLFSKNIEDLQDTPLKDKFKVVCFTETPIDQVNALISGAVERETKPKPYGLVFRKEYIRINGGNPVFYVTKEIAKPLWQLYWPISDSDTQHNYEETCKLLALVTVCDKGNDWHWEREWRIVGKLQFKITDIYCGLCPDGEIHYFENRYAPLKFISPIWGINKILDKLMGK